MRYSPSNGKYPNYDVDGLLIIDDGYGNRPIEIAVDLGKKQTCVTVFLLNVVYTEGTGPSRNNCHRVSQQRIGGIDIFTRDR